MNSPYRQLLIVACSIMVAEIALMFLFEQFPPMSRLAENLLDGVLLAVVLFPMLYLLVYRPARMQIAALCQAQESLRRMNEELEARVAVSTQQLLVMQDELVRKEKLALLGQVADTVGHELRNPLGVMNNAVYFLQATLADADDTTKEYLGIIQDEIGNAERIVSDLLDAVRTKPPHPEATGVAELIGKALRKCAVPASVTVQLEIPATLPSLYVDPMHLHQVLWNLITNGVEAMPEGGVLEIRAVADPAAQTVTISIQDNGSGIAPEQQARLFQPLFTTKARRVGLGLAVVKNLAQANGGSVDVASELGKGSTFSVTLPAGSQVGF